MASSYCPRGSSVIKAKPQLSSACQEALHADEAQHPQAAQSSQPKEMILLQKPKKWLQELIGSLKRWDEGM